MAHWYEEKLVKRLIKSIDTPNGGCFLFVAIPLPGTGAWSGVLAATFLNMKMRQALPMIFWGARRWNYYGDRLLWPIRRNPAFLNGLHFAL